MTGIAEEALKSPCRNRPRPGSSAQEICGCPRAEAVACGSDAAAAGFESQPGNSLKPRPLKIIGAHLSARVTLVFACLAFEI